MKRLPHSAVACLLILSLAIPACRIPDLHTELANAPGLAQTSYLYGADKSLITQLHAEQDRTVVPLRKIPAHVRNAVIAIEDKRFYEHRGVDIRAVFRAAYENAQAGEVVQGGSTITEQYIKQALLTPERTFERKFNEAALAWQLEQEYSKDQILAKYLNTVYLGEGAYGIQAAAARYFSREPRELTLPQAAMLAGLIRAPSYYGPLNRRKKRVTIDRRNLVLDLMLGQGMITQGEHDKAVDSPLKLHPAKAKEDRYPAAYFVDYVKRWFLSNPKFGANYEERYDLLFNGGLRIYSTLDPKLQTEAERAVNSTLNQNADPYGALTSLDPRTGEIKAMVGGRDYYARGPFSKLNLATGGSTGRQAGSAFKPYILVAALEAGMKPSKSYPAPGCIDIKIPWQEKRWHVCNAEGGGYGSLTIASATTHSVNTVYAQIVMDVGPEQAVKVAKRMGIRCCVGPDPENYPLTQPAADLEPVPSAVLGAEEVNTLEMAAGFGTLATGGVRVTPTPVTKVTDSDGRIIFEANPDTKQVIDPGVASTAVSILKTVVSSGTGTAANIGRPQFGKTGTAQNYSDAWFVGAVPQLSTAVWVGYPQGQRSMSSTRIGTVFGGTWPAQIWRSFMSKATRGLPKEDFPRGGLKYVKVEVDITRNCLPNKFTPPGLVKRVSYMAGEEPRKKCTQPTTYETYPLPSVIGLGKQRGKQDIQKLGFEVKFDYEKSPGKPGFVIGQAPSGGTELRTDKRVTLTISKEIKD